MDESNATDVNLSNNLNITFIKSIIYSIIAELSGIISKLNGSLHTRPPVMTTVARGSAFLRR